MSLLLSRAVSERSAWVGQALPEILYLGYHTGVIYVSMYGLSVREYLSL